MGRQCPACGPRSRPEAASCSSICAISRSSPAWSELSARATSTSWVFEARSSHQPSGGGHAHAVGVVDVGARCRRAAALTSSITANLRLSSTWKRSSGVLTIGGIAPRSSVTDLPSRAEAAISRIAA